MGRWEKWMTRTGWRGRFLRAWFSGVFVGRHVRMCVCHTGRVEGLTCVFGVGLSGLLGVFVCVRMRGLWHPPYGMVCIDDI